MSVIKREIKIGFRNVWTYTFLILLTLFTTAILFLQSGVDLDRGYTDTVGTVINMTLYLLPLLTLLLGGFSLTSEKEDGQWSLIYTYALPSYLFILGKWLGLVLVLSVIILSSYGVAGLLLSVFSQGMTLEIFLFSLLISLLLAITYLSMSILVGSMVRNRWQALIGGISIWFITIILWPLLMISILSQLPSYKYVQPTLQVLTVINPAELIRVFTVMKLGAGSAFGANYYKWIQLAEGPYGFVIFLLILLVLNLFILLISSVIWGRSEEVESRYHH